MEFSYILLTEELVLKSEVLIYVIKLRSDTTVPYILPNYLDTTGCSDTLTLSLIILSVMVCTMVDLLDNFLMFHRPLLHRRKLVPIILSIRRGARGLQSWMFRIADI
jgi:hypothetical protein